MFCKILPLVVLLFGLNVAAQEAWVPGEVLVRMRSGTRIDDVQRSMRAQLPTSATFKEVRSLGRSGRYHKIALRNAALSDRELERLVARMPGVEAVSLNYRLKFLAQPNDTHYGDQWGAQDMGLEQVWANTTGGTMANGTRIAVAISDQSITTTHPDLQGNIWPGSPHQGGGSAHGTEVASVVGAVGNNNLGISGVNWDVEIVSGAQAEDLDDAFEQFELALGLRQDFNSSGGSSGLMVVSITVSWVVPGSSPCNGFGDPLFSDLADAGVLVVTAGDNVSFDMDVAPMYPASCALSEHLVVTSYGPAGETPFAFGNSSVHLMAPGLAVPVATVGNGYAVADGNSYAVPNLAGAVALLYSIPCPWFAQLAMADPQAARTLVKNAILQNTTPVSGGGAICITGGKLDVQAAYQALMAQCVPTCSNVSIDFLSEGGPVAHTVLTDWTGDTLSSGGTASFTACVDDGCYSVLFTDSGGDPLPGSYAVLDEGNNVLAQGVAVDGLAHFSKGAITSGCTAVGSGNFDPTANCDDGSCCSGHNVELVLVPEDFESEGTVQVGVTSNGVVLFTGTLPIQFNNEYGIPVAAWNGCVTSACFEVEVFGSSTPLYEEGFLFLDGNGDAPIPFNPAQGFSDGLAAVFPEVCDGLDNDCDGEVDEGFLWYVDSDNDGWGVVGSGTLHCTPPGSGFAQQQGDCDDLHAGRFPGNPDLCSVADGIDNDCDGDVDEDGILIWYEDLDGDGFGTTGIASCTALPGHSSEPGDCDDTNAARAPGAEEICDDLDNDCDGFVDDRFLWYPDADGDGWGDFEGAEVHSCTPVPGYSLLLDDCDDGDPDVTAMGAPCDDHDPDTQFDVVDVSCQCVGTPIGDCPSGEVADCNGNCAPIEWVGDGICDDGSFEHNGTPIFFNCATFNFDGGDCNGCVGEICDGEDNDCDGATDEDFIWYLDADGDGWGVPGSGLAFCDAPVSGHSQQEGDCDDSEAAIFPGATEVCDGLDNDCDGITDGVNEDFQVGCSDPMACNYDPFAVCGEGTCTMGSTVIGNERYAPDIMAADINGGAVHLFELLEEGRSVVVEFFATWCPPSRHMGQADLLQDWDAHLGAGGSDHMRFIQIEIDDTTGMAALGGYGGAQFNYIAAAAWPIIDDGGGIADQFVAAGFDITGIPSIFLICPDRSVTTLYGSGTDQMPYSGNFHYDAQEGTELLNEACGCRNEFCDTGIGCMVEDACNYDPQATCPGACTFAQEWFVDNDGDGYGSTSLGVLCTQPPNAALVDGDCNDADPDGQLAFDLYVLTESEDDAGSAHYVITQGGNMIEGDVQLPAETQGIGSVPVCIGAGCFGIGIVPNDAPLNEESYIVPGGDVENAIAFLTEDGFHGSLTGPQEEACDGVDNDCDGEVDEGCEVSVRVKVLLEGPYDPASGMMQDGLRSLGLVPTVEPYSGMGYPHAFFNGGEATEPSVLAVTGTNAVVDWVVLELRSAGDPSDVLVSRCALVQRDGDVVEMDGLSPIIVPGSSGVPYHIAVRHRNHLGAMTANTVLLNGGTVDFTSPLLPTYGTHARKLEDGKALLWAGDVTFDGELKYTGAGNDRDPILMRIGGIVPTATATGYHLEDVDLDGKVRYTGGSNDRDPILVNIGGIVPTAVRQEQLP